MQTKGSDVKTILKRLVAAFVRAQHQRWLARLLDLLTNPGLPPELAPADLDIPAQAEIVLEGYVDTTEPLAVEGPFGDHTGFYTLEEDYPVFHVTTVTMRKNPIYPATLVGRPPVEDVYLGGATERIFLPLAQLTMPEIVDYHMPPEGVRTTAWPPI